MVDRRDFLQKCSWAGLALGLPAWSRLALADQPTDTSSYDGPFWVFVQANGGWDPTSFCDPKGRKNELELKPVNKYFTDDIKTAGNIPYAPVGGNKAFFEKYYKQLLVINGIDMKTNGHQAGQRHMWSGGLAAGRPSLAALIAGVHDATRPMAYISNGGYSNTAGLVALTRIGSPQNLVRVTQPNLIDANGMETYHAEQTKMRIEKARAERLAAQRMRGRLPRDQGAMNTLHMARLRQQDLKLLDTYLPKTIDASNNGLKRQAQVAIAAYKAGLALSVNLSAGGFDTHSNHDQNQFARLTSLFDGVDFLMEEADRQKVADKVIVVMGSDFGRTPRYNAGNGKDHWSVTSMMLLGAGIEGNRVVGASNEYFRCETVSPKTLELDPNGVRITPGAIHRSLRQLAGVDGHKSASKFPSGEAMPFLKT